jgi:small basic protein (TIGR04137 family)
VAYWEMISDRANGSTRFGKILGPAALSAFGLPIRLVAQGMMFYYHCSWDILEDGIHLGKIMSIDKSLRRKNSLARSRNVLTRDERIKFLIGEERWQDGRSPYNLPKVRVMKIAKKAKKAKEEEKPAEEGAEAASAPAPEAKKGGGK